MSVGVEDWSFEIDAPSVAYDYGSSPPPAPNNAGADYGDWTSIFDRVTTAAGTAAKTIADFQTNQASADIARQNLNFQVRQASLKNDLANVQASAAVDIARAQSNATVAAAQARLKYAQSPGLSSLFGAPAAALGAPPGSPQYDLLMLALTAAGVFLAWQALKKRV